MSAQQKLFPKNAGQAGVVYGFDPEDTNVINALRVSSEGALITTSLGDSGVDRELVVTTYRCKTAFTGASIGDTITATQVIDVSAAPSTVSTIWRNQTTAADLASVPSAANLEIVGSTALTDAQLRASPVATNDKNGEGAVTYITNTTPVTGLAARQVVCLTDTVFATFTRTGATGSITGVTLPAGTLLIGPVTAITLTSGAVAAYA